MRRAAGWRAIVAGASMQAALPFSSGPRPVCGYPKAQTKKDRAVAEFAGCPAFGYRPASANLGRSPRYGDPDLQKYRFRYGPQDAVTTSVTQLKDYHKLPQLAVNGHGRKCGRWAHRVGPNIVSTHRNALRRMRRDS